MYILIMINKYKTQFHINANYKTNKLVLKNKNKNNNNLANCKSVWGGEYLIYIFIYINILVVYTN